MSQCNRSMLINFHEHIPNVHLIYSVCLALYVVIHLMVACRITMDKTYIFVIYQSDDVSGLLTQKVAKFISWRGTCVEETFWNVERLLS